MLLRPKHIYSLAIIAFLFACTPGWAQTPTLVQATSCSSIQATTVTSYSCPLPNPVRANNFVLIMVNNSAGGGVPTMTDDQLDTITAGKECDDGNQELQFFYSVNVTTGPRRWTATYGVSTGYINMIIAEFYNVNTSSPADTTGACNSGTGTSLTSGSFTTGTSGDLIVNFITQDTTPSPITSFTVGSNYNWLTADINDSLAAQYRIQAAAGAINPPATMSPSHAWISVAMGFKPATSGTAPPSGILVKMLQHNALASDVSSPLHIQFPCTGNLAIASWVGISGMDVTSISDTASNTWTSTRSSIVNGGSGTVHVYYAIAPTCSNGLNLTVNFNGGPQSGGNTLQLYDVVGAASSPYDTGSTGTGSKAIPGTFAGPTTTPTTANGLIIATLGVESNTVTAGTPGYFVASTTVPEVSPAFNDENNGWLLYYNATAAGSAITWTSDLGPNAWAEIDEAFKAAPAGGATCTNGLLLLGVGC